MTNHSAESVLTPDFAQAIVRVMAGALTVPLIEDLAQEALLKGIAAFRRNRVEYPSAFFTKIVRDTVCDHWRRERVWLPLDSVDPHTLKHVVCIEEQLDLGRRLEQVRKALQRLSAEERKWIHFFYGEGLSLAQLAAMSGKSRSALKMT